ncbi:MAG: hypothetical protein A4E66_01206 [Syntrophus sp. PtaB.Bin001]|nr:MAG: hypothetical protein A4E66_01206 [Syntrophus sp. PtaB.Bin001]
MIVYSNRQNLFGPLLTNNILIKKLFNHSWFRNALMNILPSGFSIFFFDDTTTKFDAFIANVRCWAGNKLFYFTLGFSTE